MDKGGEGVQNPENFADVLNGSPLMENAIKVLDIIFYSYGKE